MPSRPDRQRHGAVSLLRLVAPAAGSDAGLWGSASRAPAQPGHPGAAAGHCRTSGGLSGHAGGSGEHPDRRGNGLFVQSSDSAAGAGEGLCRGGAGLRENPENLCRRGRENRQRRHGRPGRYPGESRQRRRAAHFPLPPLSHRYCHPGEPETGAAGLGEPGRKMDYRGRLRLGIPLRRPSRPRHAVVGRRRAGDLHEQLFQEPCALHPNQLHGASRGADGGVPAEAGVLQLHRPQL